MSLDAKINDTLISTYGALLESYVVPSSPVIKSAGIDIPGADGIFRTKPVYSSAQIIMNIVFEDETSSLVHGKVRSFLSWLSQITYGGNPDFKVEFTDDEGVFRYAAYESSDDYSVTKGIFNSVAKLVVRLSMADPFVYSTEVVRYDETLEVNEEWEIENTGIYSPFGLYLYGEGAYSVSQATSLGHSYSSAEGLASGFIINVNEQQMKYDGTLTVDGIIKIDTRGMEVYNNEVPDLVNWEGDMPELVTGDNTIVMSNMQGVPIHVVVEFYRRWL